MKSFDVQGIELNVPRSGALAFICRPSAVAEVDQRPREAPTADPKPSEAFVSWLRGVVVEQPEIHPE